MVKHVVAISFVLALTSIAFRAAQSQEPSSPKTERSCDLSTVDYDVYAALRRDLGLPEDPEESWKGKEFLLADTAIALNGDASYTDPRAARWGHRSKSKDRPQEDTISDFATKRAFRCAVKSGFGDEHSYSVIPASEIDEYFPKTPDRKRDGWRAFYEKHPKAAGFWEFSRPGFNASQDEALVYVTHSCGWLCGTGHLYLLSKTDGSWKVKNRVMLWIS